ncbi:MAG: monooxygenase, partial [Colwellia sp.]
MNTSPEQTNNNAEHFDVMIIGAGISGIGSAYHLQDQSPEKT